MQIKINITLKFKTQYNKGEGRTNKEGTNKTRAEYFHSKPKIDILK